MFAKERGEEPRTEKQLALLTPLQPVFSGQVLPMACSDLLARPDLESQTNTSSEVVEIPVLLPGWQALALEDAAHDRGLTAGEMLRHLLTDFFAKPRRQTQTTEQKQTGSQVAWS
jgi:hypothetical protein